MKRLLEVGEVDIEAIKDEFPLADFIGDTVHLKRHGKSHTGLCPFHAERTPSFHVYERDQRYHCYGCGEHGDLFDFAEKLSGWSIRETAEHLGRGVVPTYTPDRIEELRRKRLAAEEEWQANRERVRQQSVSRWMVATPVQEHPYLTAKGIVANGARLEPSGALLTPLIGPDGAVQCVQAIYPDGRKQFPEYGTVTGGFFIIGGRVVDAPEPVVICEGFATAASIHEATGRVVICTYNSGNMPVVAAFFAKRYATKEFVVAADTGEAGAKAALAASEALGCAWIAPPESGANYDFNDMARQHGSEAVRALICDGILPDGEEAPDMTPQVAIKPLAPVDPAAIPVRPWVIKGWLLKRQVAMLIAPPGVGKSTITLQQAIAICTGKAWGGWKVDRPGKVLLINVEDDPDEMQRRVLAALEVMGVTQEEIADKLFIHDGDREFLITKQESNGRDVIWSPLVSELTNTIRRHDIGTLIVDPFAETYNGDENSNNEMKKAATGFRQVARQGDCAVLLVTHTAKAAAGSVGDMYAARGGSAQTGVVRTAATLFPMTERDAEKYGLPDRDRRLYVRWDDAKSNQSLVSADPLWFRKVGVEIANGVGLNEGDQVGALTPWTAPDVFETITVEVANRILDDLASGLFKDDRRAMPKGDWAGCPIMRIADRSEEQANAILREWKKNGVLETFREKDGGSRHVRNFVRVVHEKRPS